MSYNNIDTFLKLTTYITQSGIDTAPDFLIMVKRIFRSMDPTLQIKQLNALQNLLVTQKAAPEFIIDLRQALKKDEICRQLTILQNKANQLQYEHEQKAAQKAIQPTYLPAVKAANALYAAITTNIDNYFEKKNVSEEDFKASCAEIIKQYRPALERFGWKEILRNLAFAILGAGVIYAAAGLINYAMTGHFLFFRKDIAKQVDVLEKQINQVSL